MKNLLEKIEEVKAEIQQVADQFNQLTEQRNLAQQRFTELQGALKTLQELEESENGGTDE
tara:strand:+ start:526 stop:705 length:180 start_codon:yes stop_codon:yes gene_type:complete